jgi:hypothetical protein
MNTDFGGGPSRAASKKSCLIFEKSSKFLPRAQKRCPTTTQPQVHPSHLEAIKSTLPYYDFFLFL